VRQELTVAAPVDSRSVRMATRILRDRRRGRRAIRSAHAAQRVPAKRRAAQGRLGISCIMCTGRPLPAPAPAWSPAMTQARGARSEADLAGVAGIH